MRAVANWWVLCIGLAITAPSCGNEAEADGGGGGATGHPSAGAAGLSIGSTDHGGARSFPGGTAGAADAGSAGSSDIGPAGAAGAGNARPRDGDAGSGHTGSGTAGSSGNTNTGGTSAAGSGGAGMGTAGASNNGGASAGGAGAGGSASTPTCGNAPYAHGYLGGKNLVAPMAAGPFTISASLCATKSLTVDPFQAKPMDLPASTALFLRASQLDSYPALSPEYKLVAGAAGSQVLVVSVVATTLDYSVADSNWSKGNEAVVNVLTTKQAGASGPCADVTGITYSVLSHPEAVAVYSGTSAAISTPSTSDALGSAALFFKTKGTLGVPEMVQVVGAKTGCVLTAVDIGKQTGRIPVAGGSTSGTLTVAIGG